MLTRIPDSDGHGNRIEVAFRKTFAPSTKRFYRALDKYPGIAAPREGVQWSAWHNHPEGVAELAVNLEGMKFVGWPVGRLISRELERPSLVRLAQSWPLPPEIRVSWWRDAWQGAVRFEIDEYRILDSPLRDLTENAWRRALLDAQACLGPDHTRRAEQRVTKSGKRVQSEVSPHFQLTVALWRDLPTQADATRRMREARETLAPIRDWLAAVITE